MAAEEHIRIFPKALPIFSFMRGEFKETLAPLGVSPAIRALYNLKLAQFQNHFELWQNEKELGEINRSFLDFMENAADGETASLHFEGLCKMLKKAEFTKMDVWGAMHRYIRQSRIERGTGRLLTSAQSEAIWHAAAEAIEKIYNE